MDINVIKEELKYVFGDNLSKYLGKDIHECSDNYIELKFNNYAKENLEKIKIKDLIENYQTESFLINTPDNLQEIGDFYIKKPTQIYNVKTIDDYYTKCADNHKFETSKGWKLTKDLELSDLLLTKKGFRKINKLEKLNEEEVYDFEILHSNHRYWSGNGLSSHNTAKTFVAMAIASNAQRMKDPYTPIYFDSEGAIDVDFAKKLGLNTAKARLQPVSTVEEFSTIAAQITDSFEKAIEAGETPPKILVVLDSLGNLSSTKEVTDVTEGSDKRDMTKQQGIRKLFRVNGTKFAKFGIPFIVTNHVYGKIGSFFGGNEISGGLGLKYNASIIFEMFKGKLDDAEGEKTAKEKKLDAVKVGVTITVKTYKNRYAKPVKIQIHIPFYKKPNPYVGLESFVSWDACGVLRGKCLTQKEYDKLSDKEKETCKPFEREIENKKGVKEIQKVYAFPKDTARSLVVKHENGEVPLAELFTSRVFTEEVLKQLDENVIKPTFMLPDINSLDELSELTDILDENEESDD